MELSPRTRTLLRLTLVEGVGPVLGRRLLAAFPSPEAIFEATPAALERVQGIGPAKARRVWESTRASHDALARELDEVLRVGARVVGLDDQAYPPLLRECQDAPLVLYVRGTDPCQAGSFPVAIVGSRHCTHYGVEQAERFATALGQAGLVVVSGGARGVDSAAHRASARLSFPTVAVLGCGLANCYPPENAALFDEVVAAGGSIVSELPMNVGPSAENFPARNRIIVGLSLGVLVIEAPRGSGALITARLAIDDYNREVLAIPGRIDSRASEGSNELIKRGEAAVATSPADVIDALEGAARHLYAGTHEARFAPEAAEARAEARVEPSSHGMTSAGAQTAFAKKTPAHASLTATQHLILAALDSPRSIDELCRATELPAHTIQSEVMLLEVRKAIVRQGSKLARRQST